MLQRNIEDFENFWRLWFPPSFLGRALKIGAIGGRGRTQVFESMIAAADLQAKIIAAKGDVKKPASIGNDQTSSFLLTDENLIEKVELFLQDIQVDQGTKTRFNFRTIN